LNFEYNRQTGLFLVMASRGRQMLKLLLLGDAGVGKTSLLNQFVNREFSAQYKATIGSDFSSKQLDVDGHYVTLQIWDTAGQERFQSLGPTFYRGTDCCILVYDVTKPQTFENIKKWRNEFALQLGLSNASEFPFLLLGNKSDLPEKAVQISAAREFAQMNGEMLVYEVSAKTAEGVQSAFEAIVKKALEKAPKEPDFVLPQSVINTEQKPAENKSGCC
jgi:Ras-related protein Rab-7A